MKRMIFVLIFMMSVAFVSTHHSAFASTKLKSVPENFQGTYLLKAISQDKGERWITPKSVDSMTIRSNQITYPSGKKEKITKVQLIKEEDGSFLSFELPNGLSYGILEYSGVYTIIMFDETAHEIYRIKADRETSPQ